MNQEVAHRMQTPPAQSMGQDLAMLSLFERLATDPTIPLDRIEQLMKLQKELRVDQARQAFTVDMSRLQPMLPTVEQNGRLVIHDKNDRGKVIQSTPYAKWEDINEAIRGPLGECGFALTFRSERKGDQVIVTGILSHCEGHQETTELSLALDTTGSKNNVQAVGSSISYGKRYTAGMLLNITSRAMPEADDDGKAAGDASPGRISEEQIKILRTEMQERGVDEAKFLDFKGVDKLENMSADIFENALSNVRMKKKLSEARHA